MRDMLSRTYDFTYTPAGQLATLTYPGGLTEISRYDPDGNLRRRIELNKPSHTDTLDFPADTLRSDSLGWRDGRGKVLKMAGRTWQADSGAFAYNGLGALVSSTLTHQFYATDYGWPISLWTERAHESYTQDPLGNVLSTALYDTTFQYSGHNIIQTTATHTYEPGTGRVIGGWATYTYDSSGNVATRQRVESGDGVYDTRNYYGADEKLRIVDVRRGGFGVYPGVWHYDEYRYDALGRRVLVRSRNRCQYSYGATPDSAPDCQSKIRRIIWDGDQELWEIQYPDATLEKDYDLVPSGPDSRLWGRVVYAHAHGIDHPLGVLRLEFRYPYSFGYIRFDTMGVSPHYTWRGIPDWGSLPGGRQKATGVYSGNGTPYNIAVDWPGNYSSFGQRYYSQEKSWFGSLLRDKQEATGLLYRRNRYYDAGTGRFTQEDPIGLAGGLNLYGYANGDPINYSDPFGLNPCLIPPVAVVCGEAVVTGAAVLGGLLYAARDQIGALGTQVVESARTTWQKIKTTIGIGVGLGAGESPPKMPNEEPPPPPEKISPAPPGGGKSPIEIGPDGIPRMTFPIR